VFQSREQREARRQRQSRVRELEGHIEQLRGHLERRKGEYNQAVELYKQSLAEKWEYPVVSDKGIKTWGSPNSLGLMGWELVGISTYAETTGPGLATVYTMYAFKRRLPLIPDALHSEFADILDVETEIAQTQSEIVIRVVEARHRDKGLRADSSRLTTGAM
jgi:hypothetical protein